MKITQVTDSDDDIEFLSENNTPQKNESAHEEVILSSEEEDDENLPSGSECLSRTKQFAAITGTDNALAMFYLQDSKWDLEKSINAYLEATQGDSGKKVVACFDVGKLDNDERRKTKEDGKKSDQMAAKSDETISQNTQGNLKETRFKVLSWNIDGIDGTSLETRANGVCQKILSEMPDIVLLQEVVHRNENILREALSSRYDFSSGNMEKHMGSSVEKNYYTMILSKKSTCQLTSGKDVINYGNSVMGRNLLKVKLKYANKVDLCVMTTHLESTKEYSGQRIDQLKRGFKEMLDQNEGTLVIYGGDLNLRDSELSGIGGLPNNVYDLWESTGSRKECLYTWDCLRNTNVQFPGKFKPRLRFDRIYFRAGKGKETLVPTYFELEGLEKLKNCSRFCSDHWAIQSYFEMKKN